MCFFLLGKKEKSKRAYYALLHFGVLALGSAMLKPCSFTNKRFAEGAKNLQQEIRLALRGTGCFMENAFEDFIKKICLGRAVVLATVLAKAIKGY